MAKNTVKVIGEDEGLPALKQKRLDLGGGVGIDTPIRALGISAAAYSESKMFKSPDIRGLDEVYKYLTKEKIDYIDNDAERLRNWGVQMRKHFSDAMDSSELVLPIFSYDNKKAGGKNIIPNSGETEYLAKILAYPASRVLMPPIIPGISGKDYLKFLKNFFSELDTFSHRHIIMGNIPLVTSAELKQINQFYIEQGIRLFSIDFRNKNPLDQYLSINEVLHMTKHIEKEYKEDSYIHAINVRKPSRTSHPVVAASDLLSLLCGMDSFGSSHIMARSGTEPELEKPYNLISRKDYGYHAKKSLRNIDESFSETRCKYNIRDLLSAQRDNEKLRGYKKAFNIERQGLEALRYRTLILENKTADHIKKKTHAQTQISKIMGKISS